MNCLIDFTVAIPTYNGQSRLPELLERLQNQLYTEHLSCEIIVIDNNSTDNTAKVIQTYQQNWQCPYPVKYLFEEQQGAGYARRKAVLESKGKFIGFLDDDNYPTPTWIAAAYAFGEKYSKCGAYGSQIHGEFESDLPENFGRIAPYLAITELGNKPFLYHPKARILPCCAGLVVRKEAWLRTMPNKSILTGRTEDNCLTGEDIEMVAYIQKRGWQIWYNPKMEIYHRIPEWRLKREYLIPFFRGIGLSRYVTRMINIKFGYRIIVILAYLLNDIRRVLFHLLKHGSNVKSDLATACEMELLLGSMISPYYLWKNGYLKK